LLILEELTKSFGLEYKSTTSPKEAIKLLSSKEFKPDVIVTDFNMPDMNGLDFVKELKKKRLLTKRESVLMVSAFGKEEIVNDATKAGISEFLDKPINPSYFYDAIVGLFVDNKEPLKGKKTSDNKLNLVKPGTSVIVAEDNKINQQIINELLQREGFHVTIANHGEEVLDILAEDEFEYKLILMDIQMPILNGREATKLIRESDMKYTDIPIVAMTAHALKEERDKCMEVGMNDFLTKPLEIDKLFKSISKYVDIVSVKIETKDADSLDVDFLDTKVGLDNLSNDVSFYIEILYNFLTDYRNYIEVLEGLFGEEDGGDIGIEVHTIKGLAATIGAKELNKKAKSFESKIKKGDYDYSSFIEFTNSLRDLIQNLETYFEKHPFK
jgi:CheY-like chemotaxis protein